MSQDLKVLLFTASQQRPLLLRHCIYQLQAQTYPVAHAIYVNSVDFKDSKDTVNYLQLVQDIPISNGSTVTIGYGPTAHQHHNHMQAIKLVDFENYDLYLKIDDDDIYKPDYVLDVVTDYKNHEWDISGTYSESLIDHEKFKQHAQSHALRHNSDNPLPVMPGTLAFSQKAIKLLLTDFNKHFTKTLFEDEQWIDYLCSQPSIKRHKREKSHYMYHIHQSNISKPQKID